MVALPDRQRAVIASGPAVDNVRFGLWRNIVQSGEEIWSSLRDSLRGNASEAVWAAGLSTLRLVDYHDNELVIGAPNQIQLLRVQQRYLPFITEQAQQLVGRPLNVSLTVTERGECSGVRRCARTHRGRSDNRRPLPRVSISLLVSTLE
jgi:chromosomal replication initiation ATPase DnaA